MIAVSGATADGTADIAYGTITNEAASQSELRLTTESDTEAIVRQYFEDVPVLIQVARCESTFRHTLGDGSVLKGKVDAADTGVMQINMRYHGAQAEKLGLNLNDIYDNMAYARYLYEEQGTKPWSASSPCWSRTLAANV